MSANKDYIESNVKYWKQREQQKLDDNMKDINKLQRELYEEYKEAAKNIEKEINTLYETYATDNNLSYAEANKYLNSKEFKSWKYDLKKYTELIAETGNERLELELNTLAMKSRITRLEEMLYQCEKQLNNLGQNIEEKLTTTYEGTVRKCYYKTIYDMEKKIGIGLSFAKVDDKLVKEILSFPWSGNVYSELIWENTDNLKKIVKREITQMIIQGTSARKVAKNIAEKMYDSPNKNDFKNAMRLVNTEHSYIMGESTYRAYKELGVEKYQVIVTYDNRTCEICQKHDMKTYDMKDRVVGKNASPFHPNCRCSEIPYIEDNFTTKFARDEKGKGIKIPSNMKYQEWKEKFNIEPKKYK